MLTNSKIMLLSLFFLSLLILVVFVVVGLSYHEVPLCNYLSIIFITLSSSILFPLTVGYFYDKIRERREGQSIWRLIKEFVDGGIWRVYKDREGSGAKENALTDLAQAFKKFNRGKIKMVGVSLRVFFHEPSHFFPYIEELCSKKSTEIRALVCHPDCPEVHNRAKIEAPGGKYPGIRYDIKKTIASMHNLNKDVGTNIIEYGCYSSAPYCTLIMFPDKCYFSPNILSTHAPSRLPMIVFKVGSHGYEVLEHYFDHLWANKIECQIHENKRL